MRNLKKQKKNILVMMTLGFVLMMFNTIQASETLSLAETTKLTGKITDAYSNVPLVGVTIQVKGTDVKAVTKKDGTFSIDLPKGAKTIIVSSAGYKTLEIAIKGRKVINASLSQAGASNNLWE
jgi:hypothetical protein